MSTDGNDSPLETLLLPFASGALAWPDDGALFLRARDGWPLHRQPLPGLVCVQSFKPEYDRLQRSGLDTDDTQRRFPLALVLPPRQRDEARALFAEAISRLQPGGIVVASMANDEGAKSGEADLARIGGPLQTLSKNKCRVFWTGPLNDAADEALAAQWQALDAPRPILDGRFVSRPGVFAWDRVDAASALLARHLPDDLAGVGADLGAGYGYLAAETLARNPRVAALDLYEAEARALDLARINMRKIASSATLGFHWHDVTAGLPQRYDFIVSNPPFHAQGRADRPDIGRRFIAAAADALKPGGRLWLVANRHLPYESVLDARFGSVRTVAQQDGFKAIEAIKAGR
ncbi:class I SAM-dependent methyltransferase [Luteimonas sp. SX5]|uniref:Class I SAM-dependent methyltransferase n=1 Tax=Luteimonas galliterrae TaxID=2940486 RepID=A0ABT0MN34_9GAMM|nr:class I SAM-dependent methyltransferase [Luteimonas galliterrae]MCL1635665.1 class I SAM-dependent methyltransferase [Luteimonas galliterrae]